jgi:hypothetical protein
MLLINSGRWAWETIDGADRQNGHEPLGMFSIVSSCVYRPYPEIDCQPFLSPSETHLVRYHGIG